MDLEAFRVRRHHLQLRPCKVHIGHIFREIGGKGQDRVPRLRHQPERMGQRARRAGGHKNVLLAVRQPEPFLQRSRDGLPDSRDAQAGAIAMQLAAPLPLQQPDHLLRESPGNRHGGVPQAVIEHILISDFLPSRRGELRQLTDHGFP